MFSICSYSKYIFLHCVFLYYTYDLVFVQRTSRFSAEHSFGNQSNSDAVVQALLARQQLEEEERASANVVSGPSDISSSDAVMQAMLARQRAERQEENIYHIPVEHPPSPDAVALTMAARERAEENDEYWSTTDFNRSNSVNISSMQARQRAESDREEDSYNSLTPVSSVMIQVMQARQRAEEDERNQSTNATGQNPAPSGSSALIQAMLARQQAQNEYDDGY